MGSSRGETGVPDRLRQFQTDNLLLLVGSNPLPNYVAARILCKPGGVIHLIHTVNTEHIAKQLKPHLEADCPLVCVDRADPVRIRSRVDEVLSGLEGTVGLNYTGGTKAMSVHAYAGVITQRPDAVMTYLDYEALEMLARRASEPVVRESVGLAAPVSLDTLVSLHGWRKAAKSQAPFRREARMPATAKALLGAHANGASYAWADWICTYRAACQSKGRYLSTEQLSRRIVRWPDTESLRPVVTAAMEELPSGAAGEEGLHPDRLSNVFGSNPVEDSFKWFNGEWLDSAVFDALSNVDGWTDLVMDLNLKHVQTGRDFQFDVAGTRGYQLFAFSCTTDRRTLPKLKLFEAILRARQFGGGAAAVALVCTLQDDKGVQLQDEVRADFEAEKRIRVFGQPHLPDLARHIGDWMREATEPQPTDD